MLYTFVPCCCRLDVFWQCPRLCRAPALVFRITGYQRWALRLGDVLFFEPSRHGNCGYAPARTIIPQCPLLSTGRRQVDYFPDLLPLVASVWPSHTCLRPIDVPVHG